MFSNSFTWAAEAQVEKVGERRARKQPSISSGLGTLSDSTTISSRSSSTGRQSSFASSNDSSMQTILQFDKRSMRDPDYGKDIFQDERHLARKTSFFTAKEVNTSDSHAYHRTSSDSTLFTKKWPGRTSRKVKTTLLSGKAYAPIGSLHSPANNKAQPEVLDELQQVQDLGFSSHVTRSIIRTVEIRPAQMDTYGRMSYIDTKPIRWTEIVATPNKQASIPETPKTSIEHDPAWKPPSSWKVNSMQLASPTSPENVLEQESPHTPGSGEVTHLQQLVQRMEGTKPDVIAQRLKDGYEINGDAMSVEASQLKYQLWLLAALQLGTKERPGSSCGTSSPSKSSRLLRFSSISSSSTITTAAAAAAAAATTGQEHIMVLFGSLADLYQIGIFHAHKQVTATSTFPIPQLALPPNVAYQLMSSPTYLPLPYPSSIFTHVYSPALAPSLSAPKIPSILQEMHRLLCEDGTFEIRLTDVVPKRAGLKLRMWLDDHIMINLERGFRCARPTLLMPGWLTDAGFVLQSPTTLSDDMSLSSSASSIFSPSPSPFQHSLPLSSSPSSSPLTPTTRTIVLPAVSGKASSIPVLSSPPTSSNIVQTATSSPTRIGGDRSSGSSSISNGSVSNGSVSNGSVNSRNDEYENLAALAGRALWKDVWGGFVQKQHCDWWDDPEIERECRDMGTTIEVQTICAIKKSKEVEVVRASGLGQREYI